MGIKPDGFIGIDRKLINVTLAATDGSIMKYNLSEATRVKATYREVRSLMRQSDMRIRREIISKYGWKQQEKVKQTLRQASKQVVLDSRRRHELTS